MNKTKHLKTLFLSVVFMVVIFFCGFVFSACDNNPKDDTQTIDNTQQTTDDEQTKDDTQTTDDEQTVYTITFETDSGSACEQLSVNSGQSLNEANLSLPTPEKTGYTFVGWFVDSQKTQEFNLNIKITQNQTLYAKWDVNQYTITYISNIAGEEFTNTITQDYGTVIDIPDSPKEGYMFGGWYADKSFKLSLVNKTMPADNLTLYANWVDDNLDYIYKDGYYRYYEVKVNETHQNCTSVTIPSTYMGFPIIAICDDAFKDCSSLTSITIPDSVRMIGESAFLNCSSLTSIVIPSDVSKICDATFAYCNSLTSITIPNSVTRIGNYAFNDCRGLTNITIPSSVTSIDNDAFSGCSDLKSITFAEGSKLTTIGQRAFEVCTSLTSITIPTSVTTIDRLAFYGSGLESITFAEGSKLTTIGQSAFEACTSLTSITLPASVTSIGDRAFYNCSNLEKVYYTGTETQKANINIDERNTPLTNATWYYFTENGADETAAGNWWYYDTDNTTIIEKVVSA